MLDDTYKMSHLILKNNIISPFYKWGKQELVKYFVQGLLQDTRQSKVFYPSWSNPQTYPHTILLKQSFGLKCQEYCNSNKMYAVS